eukprot:g4073.t1
MISIILNIIYFLPLLPLLEATKPVTSTFNDLLQDTKKDLATINALGRDERQKYKNNYLSSLDTSDDSMHRALDFVRRKKLSPTSTKGEKVELVRAFSKALEEEDIVARELSKPKATEPVTVKLDRDDNDLTAAKKESEKEKRRRKKQRNKRNRKLRKERGESESPNFVDEEEEEQQSQNEQEKNALRQRLRNAIDRKSPTNKGKVISMRDFFSKFRERIGEDEYAKVCRKDTNWEWDELLNEEERLLDTLQSEYPADMELRKLIEDFMHRTLDLKTEIFKDSEYLYLTKQYHCYFIDTLKELAHSCEVIMNDIKRKMGELYWDQMMVTEVSPQTDKENIHVLLSKWKDLLVLGLRKLPSDPYLHSLLQVSPWLMKLGEVYDARGNLRINLNPEFQKLNPGFQNIPKKIIQFYFNQFKQWGHETKRNLKLDKVGS